MIINISQRRSELGLTLEKIADYVGVSKSTVKKWESGYIKNMGRDKIVLLAEILQVSPLDILDLPENDKNIIICHSKSIAGCYTVSDATFEKVLALVMEECQKNEFYVDKLLNL